MKQKIKCLNIDMDGVLYDFTGQYGYMEGYSYLGRWFDDIDKAGLTFQEVLRLRMDHHANNGLFTDGVKVREADELIEHLLLVKSKYNLELNILSAIPFKSTVKDRIREDKTKWLKSVGYHDLFDNIIFSDGSWGKTLYAKSTSVLIDDYDETMHRFNEINAPFILHRKTEDTINQLSKLLY